MGTYLRASLCGQIWIYGNSFKSIVVADAQVLVEKFKEAKLWSEADAKITVASKEYAVRFKEVCEANRDMVKKLVSEDLKLYEKELHRFERVKDVCLEFEIDELLQGFNVDNNLMTPTFKKKRPQLLKRYVDIKKMYTENGEPPNDDE